jgi:hypothetical protein
MGQPTVGPSFEAIQYLEGLRLRGLYSKQCYQIPSGKRSRSAIDALISFVPLRIGIRFLLQRRHLIYNCLMRLTI